MKSTKKERIGWYFYDWANSAFTTTVVTVFLGPFLTEVAKNAANANDYISIFGIDLRSGSFFPLIIAFSVLVQALFLPLIGAFADYTSRKKMALGALAFLGSITTILMYFITYNEFLLCGALFVVANFAFGSSCTIYNAILNDIAEEDERDKISSIGWGFGYLGGGIALAFNLALFMFSDQIGISKWTATRINIASAGVWWGLFTIVTLSLLKNRFSENARRSMLDHLKGTISSLKSTIKDIKNHKTALQFLLAYIFYNDGVQAVISLSAQFGQEELKLPIEFLTKVILMVQFAAFFGALFFNKVAKKIGARRTIIICLFIWIASVVYSYGFFIRCDRLYDTWRFSGFSNGRHASA